VARSYVHEARRRVAPKRERIGPVIERLVEEHPDAVIALRFRDDLELLVSVMLSAQTTDVTVNRVTEKLFRKYRTPEDYLAVPLAELESDLRPTGTFRQKAKNLRGTMQLLLEEFDGRVPGTIAELVRLPGVGRKTANVVLGTAYSEATGVVVDTHVTRISRRLGLTKHTDANKIEQDLMRLVPQNEWVDFAHRMIHHGRRICIARRPKCPECSMRSFCPKIGVE
jgi:endonuclease III